MSFKNLKAFSDTIDNGKFWSTSYRKLVSSVAVTQPGAWLDYSYMGGNPIANYYAAAPTLAAVLPAWEGIRVPRMISGERQWLHRWSAMSGASGPTITTSQNQILMLCDYVMYYPFVDMDSLDPQAMDNTVTLPRYTTGMGLKMMAVCQATTTGGGIFTVNYTDGSGVARVSQQNFCQTTGATPGTIISGCGVASGYSCFIPEDTLGTGIRQIDSVTVSQVNGGLMALVLVKVLSAQWLREESRRTIAGTLESFGDVAEIESIRERSPLPEIVDGAFLGIVGRVSQNLASSTLSGSVETVWR